MASESIKIDLKAIPKLSRPEDYRPWIDALETQLDFAGLWSSVEEGSRSVTAPTTRSTTPVINGSGDTRRRTARRVIKATIDYNAEQLIESIDDPKEALAKLKSWFQQKATEIFGTLVDRITSLRLAEFNDVQAYTNAFRKTDNELK